MIVEVEDEGKRTTVVLGPALGPLSIRLWLCGAVLGHRPLAVRAYHWLRLGHVSTLKDHGTIGPSCKALQRLRCSSLARARSGLFLHDVFLVKVDAFVLVLCCAASSHRCLVPTYQVLALLSLDNRFRPACKHGLDWFGPGCQACQCW